MNNYIDFMNELTNRIAALEKDAAGVNIQINNIIDADTIKERYENRKNNKNIINELCNSLNDIEKEKKVLQLAKNITIEMYAKQAANRFIKAIKDETKNLLDTPDHYKKYKTAAAAALNEKDAFISSSYHRIELTFQYYSIIGRYELTVLWTTNEGIISKTDAEKTAFYNLIPVNDIEKTARDAIQAAAKIDAIKKETAAKIYAIKEQFNNINCVNIDN